MGRLSGVDPILASLLLVLIAVASVVLIYFWVSSLQSQVVVGSNPVQLGEKAKVESVQISGQELVIYVRNIGDAAMNVSAIFIYDSKGNLITSNILSTPVAVQPGEVKTVAVKLPSISGTVTVKIATKRGVEAYYTFEAIVTSGATAGVTAGNEWWNPGWKYRVPVTISNTLNANTLSDYQVLVTLNTQTLISQGKMRADCGDIRVTDNNGSQLSYWVEPNTCNTATTKIWVKVPKIPGSGTTTIYVYYGNLTATSQSNGLATFVDFDDFSTNTLSNYVQIDTGWSISNGVLVSSPNGNNFQGFICKPENLQRAYALRARIYISNQNLGDSGAGFIWGTPGGGESSVSGYIANYYYASSFSDLRRYYGSTWASLAPLPTGIPEGWHTIEVRINATTITVVRDDAYLDATARDTYYSTLSGIGFRQKAGTQAVDWWVLRKYSYPEPTVLLGNEEQSQLPRG